MTIKYCPTTPPQIFNKFELVNNLPPKFGAFLTIKNCPTIHPQISTNLNLPPNFGALLTVKNIVQQLILKIFHKFELETNSPNLETF